MVQYLFNSLYFTCFLVYVMAGRMEEFKEKFVNYAVECMEEYPLTSEDVEQLQVHKIPDKETVKCFFACTFKKAGMMDKEGKMLIKGTQDVISNNFADGPDKMKKAKDFTDACQSVNDKEVSDGAKGCERAALMIQCASDNASKLGVKL